MRIKRFLHSILMMACCILPVVLLVVFNPQLKTSSNFIYSWLFIFLCPFMHLFMMKGHAKENCEKQEKKAD
jgi:uncharacterized membrane protein